MQFDRRQFLLNSSTAMAVSLVGSLGLLQACASQQVSHSNNTGSKAMVSKLTEEFFKAYNGNDLQRLRQYVTADIVYIETATNRRIENIEPYIAANQSWKEAFPDLTGTVKNEIVSGDLITLEILWSGTHKGPLQSPKGPIPPTGKSIQVPAASWVKVRDGKYSEIRHYFDLLGMLAQLGLAPG